MGNAGAMGNGFHRNSANQNSEDDFMIDTDLQDVDDDPFNKAMDSMNNSVFAEKVVTASKKNLALSEGHIHLRSVVNSREFSFPLLMK